MEMKLRTPLRGGLLSVLAFAVSASVLGVPYSATAQDWPTGTPESQDFDSDALADLVDGIYGQGVDSLLVVRNGVMILDAYFYPYLGDRPHDVASVTKSVTTTMTGIAIEQGFLEGIDQTIWPLFADEYPDISLVGGKDQITVEDLLTLSSGLNCGFPPETDGEALLPMLASDDWVRHVLELDMRYPPGTQFAYCSPAVHLLSAVAVRPTGLDAPAFADQYLFTPLEIDAASWRWPTEQGVAHGWGALQLHPHAMAKIGQLFLNQGTWNGVPILSPEWIQHATEPSATNFGMGYIWWLYPPGFDNAYGAAGRGGQHIIVQPYQGLVVVATGSLDVYPWWSTDLLAALHPDGELAENEEAHQRLLNAIADAALPPQPIDPVPALPPMAAEVSGKIYRLEDNRFGVQCYAAHFDDETPSEAKAGLTLIDVDGTVEEFELPIGMDGVPRFSEGELRGFQVGMVGRWNSPTTLFTQYDALAGVEHLSILSDFGDDAADVQIEFTDRTGYFGSQSVLGRQVDGDTCPLNLDGGPVAAGDLYVVNDVATGNLLGTRVHWDDQDFFVFGGSMPINLGAASGVNEMWLSGFVGAPTGPGARPSGPYFGTYHSMTSGVLTFEANGSYVCPNSFDNCGSEGLPYEASYVGPVHNLAGSMVGSGPGQLPTTTADGVPVHYSADGASQCTTDGATTQCTGRVNLNAFKAVNTAPGGASGDPDNSVDVPINTVFTDPRTGVQTPLSLTITYDAVTSDGYTNVQTSSEAGGAIDPNFFVDVPGFATVFFDISSTAGITGPIRVCGGYSDVDQNGIVDGTLANECDLRVLHNNEAGPDVFVPSTLADIDELCPFDAPESECPGFCINTVANELCGWANSLSSWTVKVENEAPVAAAGEDRLVEVIGAAVTLDGSGSYDDRYDIRHAWSFVSKPSGSGAVLQGANTLAPTFIPDVYGDYEVELVVTDTLERSSEPDTVVASFTNLAPVAEAGDTQDVRVGDDVWLDGSGSRDPNEDLLNYEWSLVTAPVGSGAMLDDPTSETPTFAPDVSGSYEIELIVSDGLLDSEPDAVTIFATTAEGELADKLREAIDAVRNLESSVFKNRSLQKNMAKHIGQALGEVDQGKYDAALDKLEAVVRKTDGCANEGVPDPNDWIRQCGAQEQIHPLLVHAFGLVDEILGG